MAEMSTEPERKHNRWHIGSGHFATDQHGCDGGLPIKSMFDPSHPCASVVNSTERGYALVGLMVIMLVALILTAAAAPSIKYEAQREREEEMFWRGHQIQKALVRYSAAFQNRLPTELEELVDGVTINTQKMRLLRPSALCDPMTPCEPGETNWRLVHPGDPLTKELLDALLSMQQQQDGIRIPVPQLLRRYAQLATVRLPGQESSEQSDDSAPPATAPGNLPGFDPSGKRPIIGVVSSKSDQMFRSYYGIDLYDHALFFPGVPVVAGGFNRAALIGVGAIGGGGGMGTGGTQQGGPGGSNCQPGEIRVGGQCIRVGVPNNPSGQGRSPK
jgi:Tfp pilus assembly protein PilE